MKSRAVCRGSQVPGLVQIVLGLRQFGILYILLILAVFLSVFPSCQFEVGHRHLGSEAVLFAWFPMEILLTSPELERLLADELHRVYPGVSSAVIGPGVFTTQFPSSKVSLPPLVFARQWLPEARAVEIASIRSAAEVAASGIVGGLPDEQPWRLHVVPHYGSEGAGQNRCRLIQEAVLEQLQKRRRRLRKKLSPATTRFGPSESLVQLVLIAPDQGFLSLAPAPVPRMQYRLISPFLKGGIPIASDKAAPSRAFAKLLEAEQRLGLAIGPGDTCADLGATPGSWSYIAINRGALVQAVDRSPLRDDLMRNKNLVFHQGDAFAFEPSAPVDWLLCDIIAAPARSIGLLTDWLKRKLCRRFIVTIKFKGEGEYAQLEGLKAVLAGLAQRWSIQHLCANKNEACAFGELDGE